MPVRTARPAFIAVLVFLLGACAAPVAAPQTAVPTDAPTETDEPASDEPASDEPTESSKPSEPPDEPTDEELDYTLPSNFGSTDLTAGFTPDPFSVEMVSGGPIDVSYLGDECRGFATASSDYDVTYTAGGQDLLRFYFVADTEDTTLIINAPDASWHCNDDAPGTIDPMIDFTNPESGRYDIWIGSYDEGDTNSGALYVTEIESNSP
jgi:hypothetical protein